MNVAVYAFKKTFFVILFALYFFSSQKVLASTTDGTIPADSYAWGENLSWINFGLTDGNIHVTNTAVTGYAWSQNAGWINFSPTNGGVTNNTSGQLGGNAWSSGLGGWIPFDGVTINSSGRFTGIAGITGTTVGRINFDCTNCNITTDWRPSADSTSVSSTTTTTSTTGGGGGVASQILATPTSTTVSAGQIFTPPTETTIPTALFDITTESLPSKLSQTAIIQLILLIFALLLILLIFVYIIYRRLRHRKFEKVRQIKN